MASIPVVEICIRTLVIFIGFIKATFEILKSLTKINSTKKTTTIVANKAKEIGPFS
jgi:hypothetical protein